MTEPHLRWEASRFYWCVLEAPGWTRAGPMPDGLKGPLAAEVPAPVDALHAVVWPDGAGRLVVCALARTSLLTVGDAISLCPDRVPEHLGGTPTDFNLLVGEFAPGPVVRARRWSHVLAASCFSIVVLLIALGLHRRALRLDAEARSAIELAVARLQSTGLDERSLSREVEAMRESAAGRPLLTPTADASISLARVLAAWPSHADCTTHGITVDTSGVALSLSVPGDPSPLLASLRPPSGWSIDDPRINSSSGVTRLSLTMRPGATR